MTAANIPEHLDLSVKRKRPLKEHPWQETIKYFNKNRITRAHNSVKNHGYPAPRECRKFLTDGFIIFTIVGNRVTKEFIYCVKMVQGMHKYRGHTFGAPIIKGVTGVEWPLIYNELKLKYGRSTTAFCSSTQVVVLYNNTFLGGEKELKDFIEERYIYHVALNYATESIDLFRHFVQSTRRACAYMHISIDDETIGCLIFMLYSDITPKTCENFLRLCQTTKGGYSGTPVHRIVEDSWIQCGGFELKDTPLDCENFIVPHDKRGVLGMCNFDRGVDCSTQFYVLLQPASWMNYQYVAIGQLIDGEETLKKIEKVPTFYESPTKNIKILTAGILNLECDDIMVNRGAVAYIDAHTEDLVSLGEMLYEWLMELVALELEFRHLQAYGGEEEITTGMDSSSVPTNNKVQTINTNLDFDVEDYQLCDFEAEAYRYDQVSVRSPTSTQPKQKRPYYIPFTDVPYGKENDSNYDLKRFLQGDYCLQADLDLNLQKKQIRKNVSVHQTLSNIMDTYLDSSFHCMMSSHRDIDSSSEDLLEGERGIFDSRENLEQICFGGSVIRDIGMKYAKDNPFQEPLTAKFNDEEMRRIRMALADFRARKNTSVSIKTFPWSTQNKVKRRQTSYHSSLLELEDEEDHPTTHNKAVSILEPTEKHSVHYRIQRKQTGLYEDMKHINAEDMSLLEITEEEEDTTRKMPKTAVSINRDVVKWDIEQTRGRERSDSGYDYIRPSTRHSVLQRLYEGTAIDSTMEDLTLKNYTSKMNVHKDAVNFDFLKSSKFQLACFREPSYERVIEPLTFGHTKKQPRISVAEYKRKNQLYAEKIKREQAKKKL